MSGEKIPEHRCSISPDLAAEMEAARDQQSQPDDVLRTATGKVLTDADVQALADEAERGYDLAAIRPTYGISRGQARSLPVEDLRLTRARAAFEALRNSTHATVLVGLDLLDLAVEQQRSIWMLTEENGALKARLAEAIQSVGELAPSPTQALLQAARAVLAAAERPEEA